MAKLFSTKDKRFLKKIQKTEKELNHFLVTQWSFIFPNLTFIKNEFQIDGNVRSKGTSGRIDILAFNPKSKKMVVFELKNDFDKNVNQQASDYKDFIEDHFSDIYLQATQKYGVVLPKYTEMETDNIEVIIIAKKFTQIHINGAKKSSNITLIKYFWFEDDLFLIDYINNDPDDLIEKENTEKIRRIKNIIQNKTELSDIESFFFKKEEAKRFFSIFINLLNQIGEPTITIQQTKIRVSFNNETFSIIPYGGKTGRKSFLQINTNIDVNKVQGLLFEDRIRSNQKKKGSLGNERYEIFIQNETQMINFVEFIKEKFTNG
ncbi:MAG: hypothetical protein CVT89_05945 [Candidatus Altiarchaeales archaeon HGW-Altiarchaeales-2]|nr:MAG: hypothetical protein CVT89_05945 [Candidatus Altiarchaeales archaeon HGW-Altiarchaeales-2]